jgi:hypothetical protein
MLITRWVVAIGFLVLLQGCYTAPPRVDPLDGLVSDPKSVKQRQSKIPLAELKRSRVALVSGGNFETYVKENEKGMKKMESSGAFNAEEMRLARSNASPTSVAAKLASALNDQVGSITPVGDLQEAKEKELNWIIVFDFLPESYSTTSKIYVNLMLLDRNLEKAVNTPHLAEFPMMEIGSLFESVESIMRRSAQYSYRIFDGAVDQAVIKFKSDLKAAGQ